MRWNRTGVWAALAVVAAVCVRVYFIHAHPHIQGDALVYGDLAHNLLRHHVFGLTENGAVRPTLIRLPGYPLLMAACFALFGPHNGAENYTGVLYTNLVLDLATCCLVGALAGRLLGRRAGLAALWLSALCPFMAAYVAAGYTETPAMFCVALAFYSLERWRTAAGPSNRAAIGNGDGAKASAWNRWLAPLALALAWSCLLRPDRVLLAASVLAAMTWLSWHAGPGPRLPRLAPVGAVFLAILLPLAVWGARNWRVFHVMQPLAPRYATDPGEFISYGFNRWYRTWAIEFKSTADIYWNYDGSPLSVGDLPARAVPDAAQQAATASLFAEYNQKTVATPAIDAEFAALAKARIRAHPLLYYVELPVARVADMWLRPRTELFEVPMDWWTFRAHPRVFALSFIYAALNLAYLALAGVGGWCWKRERCSSSRALAYAMAGFVLLRSAMLLTMDNSEPRYTMDCYPIVLLFAALALAGRNRDRV